MDSPNKRNILVFPCGSEIGLDIHASVMYSTHFHLIGASSVEDHGRFVYSDYIGGVPLFNEPDFVSHIKDIIDKRQIAAIYPTMDSVLALLKEHEAELGCIVIASPVKTVRTCLSKSLTYRTLQGVLPVPKVYEAKDIPQDAFPVFAKPDIGYGARGTAKLNTQAEADAFLQAKEDMLLLEYLPGEEFTVDCFTDKAGNLLYCGARKRNRIKDGISVNTFFIKNQEPFFEIAQAINKQIEFRGAWFFQVKRNRGNELCLLEIASRLGGSSLLSNAIGVNFALLSIFDALGYDVEVVKNRYDVVLDRALGNRYRTNLTYDSVYCDYDDCLLLEKSRVNTRLVAFLYQCLNNGKRLYLLTKHEGSDLEDELKRYRLNNLFDEIIHIGQGDSKSDFIRSKNAIFIDDSYSERVRITKTIGIPVFSPEMIDVLM